VTVRPLRWAPDRQSEDAFLVVLTQKNIVCGVLRVNFKLAPFSFSAFLGVLSIFLIWMFSVFFSRFVDIVYIFNLDVF
jgi:hypothetical protein